MIGNVGLHSVDQRLGNFAVVVAVLVVEQLLYHSVSAAEPISFGNNMHKINKISNV